MVLIFLQGSLYEIEMKHGLPGYLVDASSVDQESYPMALIQNKRGDADPEKGIPPALFNLKLTTQGIRSPTVSFHPLLLVYYYRYAIKIFYRCPKQ